MWNCRTKQNQAAKQESLSVSCGFLLLINAFWPAMRVLAAVWSSAVPAESRRAGAQIHLGPSFYLCLSQGFTRAQWAILISLFGFPSPGSPC